VPARRLLSLIHSRQPWTRCRAWTWAQAPSGSTRRFGSARLLSADADRLPTGPGTGETACPGPAERFTGSVPAATSAGADSVASQGWRHGSQAESAYVPSPADTGERGCGPPFGVRRPNAPRRPCHRSRGTTNATRRDPAATTHSLLLSRSLE